MKPIYFVAGLPRSGSTLLMNILNQNPNVYGTASSGIADILRSTRDAWDDHAFFKAMPEPDRTNRKIDTLRGLFQGYFGSIEKPICFDKNRGWPAMFELVGRLFGDRDKIRVIVCVRDLRDVLASFEKLYRKTAETSSTFQERNNYLVYRTAVDRAQFILRLGQPVGFARNVIIDAVTRGFKRNMFFLDYADLTSEPKKMMQQLYEFVGEEPCEHDFDNVEQVTVEDDSVHGFVGLHDIKPKIQEQEPQWPKVFSEMVTNTPFWNDISQSAKFWKHL